MNISQRRKEQELKLEQVIKKRDETSLVALAMQRMMAAAASGSRQQNTRHQSYSPSYSSGNSRQASGSAERPYHMRARSHQMSYQAYKRLKAQN
jgi:hypothetical protein